MHLGPPPRTSTAHLTYRDAETDVGRYSCVGRPTGLPTRHLGRGVPGTGRHRVGFPRRVGMPTGSRLPDSLLGHHMWRPMSMVRPETSTDRTTSVSSSTPKATANPISVNWVSGSVPSTANVPARTRPGRGNHTAGCGEPDEGLRVWSRCRKASSRTLVIKKMFVVDAERDQEYEHEQRQRAVSAGEAEDVPEHERTDPERSREREHGPFRRGQAARTMGAQKKQPQDDQYDGEHDRDDQIAVVPRGILDVEVRPPLCRRPERRQFGTACTFVALSG